MTLFINSKTLDLEKQPEKEREGGNLKHENKHVQEAGKRNEEDDDDTTRNPAEVTMNGNDRKLFPILSYLVAISLAGASVNVTMSSSCFSCHHHLISCHHVISYMP